jgi:hypothetical protein
MKFEGSLISVHAPLLALNFYSNCLLLQKTITFILMGVWQSYEKNFQFGGVKFPIENMHYFRDNRQKKKFRVPPK